MTASADEACSAADLIIITAPSHVRESVLHSIAPALPRHKQVFVGAIPGFGGFDWMAEKAFGGLSNIVIWGMKDVPHIAFDLVHGKVSGWGAKSQLYVAVHCRETPENTDILLDYLKQLYEAPVTLLSNYPRLPLHQKSNHAQLRHLWSHRSMGAVARACFQSYSVLVE